MNDAQIIVKPGASERLWLDVFGDTEQYVNLVFDRVLAPDLCVCAEADGSVISQACGVKYQFSGARGVYLCGLATSPEWRGRGVVSRLTDHLLEKAKNENFDFAFLIPATKSLVEFYENRGWRSWILQRKFTVYASKLMAKHLSEFIFSDTKNINSKIGEWWQFYKDNLELCATQILSLSEQQFSVAAEENKISSGMILTAYSPCGRKEGILFAGRDESGTLYVQYCVGTNDDVIIAMLAEVMRREGVSEIEWRLCDSDTAMKLVLQIGEEKGEPRVYAMARPLTPRGEEVCRSAGSIHLMLD